MCWSEVERVSQEEELGGTRAKAGGLKNSKEASVADAERMEGKRNTRWGQSGGPVQ